MGLYYLDDGGVIGPGHLKPYDIARLISSYMEPENCDEAVRQSFRIVELLLLSNHLDHAQSLATALYTHMPTILSSNSSKPSSRVLQYFWFTHPEYAPPPGAPAGPLQADGSPDNQKAKEEWERQQWNSYRECTRTGWMLEHCNLPEPANPHIWHKTDDAAILGMCTRLLAKDKTFGQYPPVERLGEALAAAEKLYSQPQVPASKWVYDYKGSNTARRHSYYIYRRLAVELAIRVGDVEKAAEIFSQGLVLDGFNTVDGASLDRFLLLPQIYAVLPMLAAKGQAGNPYFIEEAIAREIVQQITETIERRAEFGRQWSLAPDRVGWKELLDRLANAAWAVNSKEYRKKGFTSAADILNPPASEEDIEAAEAEVGELPEDLKEMYRISEGFKGGWHFLNGGIGGCKTMAFSDWGNEFENLLDDNGLELNEELAEDVDDLELHSIVDILPGVGVDGCDCFRHSFVSPSLYRQLAAGRDDYVEGEYRYWSKASWHCETGYYKSVREYVALTVERLERMVEDGETESGPGDSEDETELAEAD